MFEREYLVTMTVQVKVYAMSPKEAQELVTLTTANWHDWDIFDAPRGIEIQETGL